MIPGTTMQELLDEASLKWGDIWDDGAQRITVMLICKRKERKMMELHGDLVEHSQPVLTIFHRPRTEAHLLSEQGFEPKSASFQFVNIANNDLGLWMQTLINNEGWKRSSLRIRPLPYGIDVPNQRRFENINMMCFKHPELESIEDYFLPFPPTSVVGKAFVSLPRRQAAELAKQQADLGLGLRQRAAEPEPAPTPAPEPIPTPVAEEVPLPIAVVEESIPLPDVASVSDSISVPAPTPVPIPEPEPAPPVVEKEPVPDIEKDFRDIVSEMLAEGIEPSEMMGDSRFAEISERAEAVGFETWPVFMEMTQ